MSLKFEDDDDSTYDAAIAAAEDAFKKRKPFAMVNKNERPVEGDESEKGADHSQAGGA